MKIKFRVFYDGKMVYPGEERGDSLPNAAFALRQDGFLMGYFQDKDTGERWWYSNLEVGVMMLSTGLVDKNEQEIYDGDILEFDEREWGHPLNKWIVQWDANLACWDMGGGRVKPSLEDCAKWKTIIGNKYENPELMKGVQ